MPEMWVTEAPLFRGNACYFGLSRSSFLGEPEIAAENVEISVQIDDNKAEIAIIVFWPNESN